MYTGGRFDTWHDAIALAVIGRPSLADGSNFQPSTHLQYGENLSYTVTMASLHLLGIPRELRDTIYDYLHEERHELNIETKYNAVVGLRNCPLVNVLLVHSQLREEYLESRCFRNISLYFSNFAGDGAETVLASPALRNISSAFRIVRECTVYIELDSFDDEISSESIWSDVETVVDVLAPNIQNLAVLCIAVQTVQPRKFYYGDLSMYTNEDWTMESDFSSPPRELLELPFTKGGEGYRLLNPRRVHSLSAPDRASHDQHHVGIFTFSRESHKQKTHLISHDDIIEQWPARECHPTVLQMLPEEKHQEVVSWSRRIMGWRDLNTTVLESGNES
jgi:hypothetical protein